MLEAKRMLLPPPDPECLGSSLQAVRISPTTPTTPSPITVRLGKRHISASSSSLFWCQPLSAITCRSSQITDLLVPFHPREGRGCIDVTLLHLARRQIAGLGRLRVSPASELKKPLPFPSGRYWVEESSETSSDTLRVFLVLLFSGVNPESELNKDQDGTTAERSRK
ncbi:hypothetical protein VTJ04DRAFT_1713 [Mycothermus thermophilus]|uniref:uncharacterized protein n=1 Tax=Humicola insolens TaxID=85995 RepID=UPI0037428497